MKREGECLNIRLSLGRLTCASFQTDAFRLQPSADGDDMQPVEGAGSQTSQQQRRRASRNAVVLNHNTVKENSSLVSTQMWIHSF